MSNHLVVLTVLITLSETWGSSFLAIKEVISSMPPLFAFGIRFAISGILSQSCFIFMNLKIKGMNQSISDTGGRANSSVFIMLGGQGLLCGAHSIFRPDDCLIKFYDTTMDSIIGGPHSKTKVNSKYYFRTCSRICWLDYPSESI